MKKIIVNIQLACTVLISGLSLLSCSDYLDIMPDNVLQYEDLFSSRQRALSAMAMMYNGTPYDQRNNMPWTLGDEWIISNPQTDMVRTEIQGNSIMRGNQSAENTLLSTWTGRNTIACLYTVIRDCDMFILNVDKIPDMTAEEKADWKGQAKFLKAYYLFLLMQSYGPVVLPKVVDPNALHEDLFLPRSSMEECFDYVINLLNEAIPDLKGRAGYNELGMADKVTAMAMKSRILLYRASPFYNGNSEYFSNFLDHKGEHFFSQTYDKEKWKVAADAADEALAACEQYGVELYHFKKRPYDYDTVAFRVNPDKMQILYDLRMRIVDRWNEEIIWGTTRITGINLSSIACIKKPATYGGPAPAHDGSAYGAASYQAMERYYTEHGLPLNEDRTVVQNSLLDIVTTPNENSPDYTALHGFMQPGVPTIKMYMGREPRFYADLGITGGYYRSHQVRINTMMFAGTDGGFSQAIHGSYYNPTGIAIQKCVHPESYFLDLQTQIIAPYPLIRLADLYLMKAEALNEYSGPSQEVYDAINAIRERAGIPKVEESYSKMEWVTDGAKDKHLTQPGMREIILRERANEFAFEAAHRFYDMQRWRRSVAEFSKPVWGWNFQGTNPTTFFTQKIVQGRTWSISDCLWPIENTEMEKNTYLIQNPGW
jgi:hypothetical protein